MKILVTGGAGFIGSHLADKLIKKGNEVFIIDNLSTGSEKNINKNAKFYKADIVEKEKIEKIILDEKPDVIFHLAAQINVRKSTEDPVFDLNVNVIGTINLIDSFLKTGKQDKKFIFASTGGAIYGECNIIPTPETVEPFPLSPYGISKLTVEKFLNYYKEFKGLRYVSLRLGNVYGPRQNPYAEAGVVAIFTNKMLKGEKPVIFGDGNQTRDFIYVDDVVNAFILTMEKDADGIYNVGTEKETSVNEIFELIKKYTGSDVEKIYGEEKEGDIRRSCLSTEKIKRELGWKPEYGIENGLKKTVEWFKEKIAEI